MEFEFIRCLFYTNQLIRFQRIAKWKFSWWFLFIAFSIYIFWVLWRKLSSITFLWYVFSLKMNEVIAMASIEVQGFFHRQNRWMSVKSLCSGNSLKSTWTKKKFIHCPRTRKCEIICNSSLKYNHLRKSCSSCYCWSYSTSVRMNGITFLRRYLITNSFLVNSGSLEYEMI